jgi:D-glycero-D-manno-heptose 1,7-bisphosphate phosphatase
MMKPGPAIPIFIISTSKPSHIKFQMYNSFMFPAIFLDRDGVLIENKSDYVRDWSQVKVFPEAIRTLSHSALHIYKIVIVTNQSAVGRGLISLETAAEINRQLVHLIHHSGGQVDAVYLCPHKPDDDCSCRKPKPGLLLQAANELSLDLQRSWMIGDAWSDVQAGQAASVRQSILLRTGRGREQLLKPRPENIASYLVFDNLSQAVDAIFAFDKPQALSAQP